MLSKTFILFGYFTFEASYKCSITKKDWRKKESKNTLIMFLYSNNVYL